jgi:hypothetical protein
MGRWELAGEMDGQRLGEGGPVLRVCGRESVPHGVYRILGFAWLVAT